MMQRFLFWGLFHNYLGGFCYFVTSEVCSLFQGVLSHFSEKCRATSLPCFSFLSYTVSQTIINLQDLFLLKD